MKEFNLEDRLIAFSVLIIEIVNGTKKSKAGNHLAGQLIRCGTSSALNYGEAQSAESRKDFIHKMKVILKELRETRIALRILKLAKLCELDSQMSVAIQECNELISIFVKSIETAKRNMRN